MTNIDNAKLIEVILVSAVAGDGTKENPTRCVQELWTKDVLCVDGRGCELTLADVLKSEEPTIEETVLSRLAVEQLPAILGGRASATEKNVLLRRINGMKQREIAEVLCLSQSYVSRILTGIKNKIQRTLAA